MNGNFKSNLTIVGEWPAKDVKEIDVYDTKANISINSFAGMVRLKANRSIRKLPKISPLRKGGLRIKSTAPFVLEVPRSIILHFKDFAGELNISTDVGTLEVISDFTVKVKAGKVGHLRCDVCKHSRVSIASVEKHAGINTYDSAEVKIGGHTSLSLLASSVQSSRIIHSGTINGDVVLEAEDRSEIIVDRIKGDLKILKDNGRIQILS